MRSHLTRPVFRQLLDGRTIVHNGCLYRRRHVLLNACPAGPKTALPTSQRRTFWDSLFQQPSERRPATIKVYPGLAVMRDLSRAEMLDSRRPPKEELRTAWQNFFKEKEKRAEGIDEIAAGHALRTLVWLQDPAKAPSDGTEISEKPSEVGSSPSPLDVEDIRRATQTVIRTEREKTTQAHQTFALSLRDALRASLATSDSQPRRAGLEEDILAVVTMLSHVGRSTEARDMLDTVLSPTPSVSETTVQAAYSIIIADLDHQGAAEDDVDSILQSMATRQIKLSPSVRRDFIKFFARRDNLKKAINQLEALVAAEESSNVGDEVVEILEACTRSQNEKVGRAVLERYLEPNADSQKLWTSIFRFTAAVGRGADEVERMMTVMEKRKPSTAAWALDVGMINDLVRFAMDRKDSYLAERFIALGQKWSIQPDSLTYLYQMSYRLSTDDVDGAIAAYHQAQGLIADETDESSLVQEINATNELVQAMCKVERRYSFESIMKIVDDLNAKSKTRFHAATVACLSILHLRREEYHDVVDLLGMHTADYSIAERHIVRDAMVAYCFDRRNSIAKVWDCYQIFRQTFNSDTPREIRTTVMNEFYKRRRADMGYHVFSHMRDSPDPDIRATTDTYVDALVGISNCRDEETLEFVHNQLKLDPHLEPDTRLNNALMLAYIETGDQRRAIEFWEDIVGSREGPSYNSIRIVLRACEVKPYGVEQGKIIWDRLMQLEIDVTKEVFTAWCACLAGNSYIDAAKSTLQRAGEYGIEPDVWVVGSIFNAASRNPYAQVDFSKFVAAEYPELMQELKAKKFRRQRNGSIRFNHIDQALPP